MNLNLIPKTGIGPIKLGMTREKVRASMDLAGISLSFEKSSMDYFQKNIVQVEYEDDGTVSFIGVASDRQISLIYQDTDLFDISAEEAFSLIAKEESSEHSYREDEYVFPDQIVTLYEADSQYDRKGQESRSVWGQIGLGDQRYLDFTSNQ